MECETQESVAGYTKHVNLYLPETYMYRYGVNQHLTVLNLYSASINTILVTKFTTVKVSQNLSLMQNMSIK